MKTALKATVILAVLAAWALVADDALMVGAAVAYSFTLMAGGGSWEVINAVGWATAIIPGVLIVWVGAMWIWPRQSPSTASEAPDV